MKISNLLKLLCLFLELLFSARSQTLTNSSYTIKDGLPSNTITALLQDSRGYLWIGTNNGLARYDGEEFKLFSTINGLSNNWITTLVENPFKKNEIWVGTIAGGVVKMDNGNVKVYNFSIDPDWNNVENLCIDGNGVVWFTVFNGFLQIHNEKINIVKNENAPKHPDNMIVSKTGNLWCSEHNIIYRYDHKKNSWQTLKYDFSEKSEITSLLPDTSEGETEEDNILIGASNKSIFLVNKEGILKNSGELKTIPYEMQFNGNGKIIIRNHSSLFSLNNDNLDGCTILPVENEEKLPADVTPPILIDKERNLWVGTWSHGLLKVSNLNLYMIQFPQSLNDNNIVQIDSAGHLWAGGIDGVWEFYKDNNNSWKKYFHSFYSKNRNKNIFISLLDRFGRLWLNNNHETIQVYSVTKGGKNQSILHPVLERVSKMLEAKTILGIYVDREDRLWCSIAKSGVELINLKNQNLIKFYRPQDGIPGKNVRAIFEDSKHNIWIGGWQEGLTFSSSIENPPAFTRNFMLNNHLTDNMIRSIFEDEDGSIWIGTRHHGIIIYNNGKFSNISINYGLLSNSIWNITRGPGKEIWLGTDVGVERIDQKSLRVIPAKPDLMQGQCESICNYKNQFWTIIKPGGFFIYENDVNQKITPPVIEISTVLVNGNQFLFNKEHHLSYDQNSIAFLYSGLTYKDEKATMYEYRLLGLDTSWNQAFRRRSVSYASISPGKYIFQVRARNSEGLVSKSPASFGFVIAPPYWKEWWFIISSCLITGSLLILLYRYRIKKIIEMERLRLRIARDLHDDVGTNLSSIILTSQLIEKKIPIEKEGKEYLRQLNTIAMKTQNTLKETVWLLNPINDSSEDLILRLKTIAGEILIDIQYSFKTIDNLLTEKLPLEIKRNVILIYKEILQNILKHSAAKSVEINLTRTKNNFIIVISDNGVGFDPTKVTGGNGLKNLKSRANSISAQINIDTKIGKGTTVTFSIDITQMRTGKSKKQKIS